MASDTVHTIEILLKNLATKSVTFAPARATIVREIQDVQIKVREMSLAACVKLILPLSQDQTRSQSMA